MLFVRRASKTDCISFSKRIRKCDEREIKMRTGGNTKKRLIQLVSQSSSSFAICQHARTLGMFGVMHVRSNHSGNIGAPWLLGSEELFKANRVQFIRDSNHWLRKISEDYVLLENFVLEENGVHIIWLKKLGFKFVERFPEYGVGKVAFWKFRVSTEAIQVNSDSTL